MANSRQANVLFCDTDATTYAENLRICGVKYIGASTGTLQIQDTNSSGKVLWKESGSANVWNPDVEIRAKDGIYVALTNGASAYIYFE